MTKIMRTLRTSTGKLAAAAAGIVGVVAIGSLTGIPTSAESQASQATTAPVGALTFIELLQSNDQVRLEGALQDIRSTWTPAYIPQLLEIVRFTRDPWLRAAIFQLLREKTQQDFGSDFLSWSSWLWQQPELITEDYAEFKAILYSAIDPRFGRYFEGRAGTSEIRLDEIVWGGVLQDGIPPLRQPKMLAASNADYLDDDNVVFGIVVNGEAHAYPKRILAWHEMFVNEIGGVEIAGVYCTLCGTVIPYRTQLGDKRFELGTSGFLYRSNKLMYDRETQSLWNTFRGTPVVGPLVGSGIELEREAVVTTTWGEWRKRHPGTLVLSPDTGHTRDYGEGVAYQDYFATDELMFTTPFEDKRLKNKQEVVALRFTGGELAIDTAFLGKNPLYTDSIGLQDFLVVTDSSGSSRVYDRKDVRFTKYDGVSTLQDSARTAWTLKEEHLVAKDGRTLARLPSHRAFWFGWHASFPSTRLVK